jgi:hypothetical protein
MVDPVAEVPHASKKRREEMTIEALKKAFLITASLVRGLIPIEIGFPVENQGLHFYCS